MRKAAQGFPGHPSQFLNYPHHCPTSLTQTLPEVLTLEKEARTVGDSLEGGGGMEVIVRPSLYLKSGEIKGR